MTRYTPNCSAFRGVVPVAALPSLPDPTRDPVLGWPRWPSVALPIGNRDELLLVERQPTPWPVSDWLMPAQEGDQLRHFRTGTRDRGNDYRRADQSRWGLFTGRRWVAGPKAVSPTGDAACAGAAPRAGRQPDNRRWWFWPSAWGEAPSTPLDVTLERYEDYAAAHAQSPVRLDHNSRCCTCLTVREPSGATRAWHRQTA